jgi:hypothetical protein
VFTFTGIRSLKHRTEEGFMPIFVATVRTCGLTDLGWTSPDKRTGEMEFAGRKVISVTGRQETVRGIRPLQSLNPIVESGGNAESAKTKG